MKRDISAYIRRIRNANKRAYALAYYSWLMRDPAHEEQDPPERGKLSYMAAQAVRMELVEMWVSP